MSNKFFTSATSASVCTALFTQYFLNLLGLQKAEPTQPTCENIVQIWSVTGQTNVRIWPVSYCVEECRKGPSVIHLLQPTTSAIRAICRPSGYPLYTINYTLYTVHCTLYTVHCILYTVNCRLYTVQCTVYNTHVRCPLCSLYLAAVWSGWLSSPTASSVRNHIPD